MKIIKFGDKRGIGAIVETTGFFGGKKTWSLTPSTSSNGEPDKFWALDEWICLENGARQIRCLGPIGGFYTAHFNVRTANE